MSELKAAVSAAATRLGVAIADQGTAETAKAAWKNTVVCETKKEFLEMGVAGLQAGYGYYNQIFNDPSGKLYKMKRAYQGATVFNPLKTRSMDFASVCISHWPARWVRF